MNMAELRPMLADVNTANGVEDHKEGTSQNGQGTTHTGEGTSQCDLDIEQEKPLHTEVLPKKEKERKACCKKREKDGSEEKGFRKPILVAVAVLVALVVVAVGLFLILGLPVTKHSRETPETRLAWAKSILQKVPLVDGHNDLPILLRIHAGIGINKLNLTRDLRPQLHAHTDKHPSHTDIPRLKEGLLGGQFWSIYVDCAHQYRDATERTLEQIDLTKRMIRQYSDFFVFVTESQDILSVHQNGKLASLLGLEGAHSISDSPGIMRMMYDLGIRYMTLTHNCNNVWVDNHGAKKDKKTPMVGGLTQWGKIMILEMNRIGLIVDLSHVSQDAMHDVLDVSRAPVIFSHSSAFALCPNTRNVPDDVLKRLPKNGGVVMVTFVTIFVNCTQSSLDDDDAYRRTASLAQVADHIEHIKEVAGVEHIGIGGDYDGIPITPVGLEDVSKYPHLFAELLRRGWSSVDLEKLAGRNIIRAMEQVEQVRDMLVDEPPLDVPVDWHTIPDTSCMDFNFTD